MASAFLLCCSLCFNYLFSYQVLVTIRIEDVNDSPPAFESDKLTFYIAENSPIGSLAGVLHAKDPDEGQNAVVQYSIIGNLENVGISFYSKFWYYV